MNDKRALLWWMSALMALAIGCSEEVAGTPPPGEEEDGGGGGEGGEFVPDFSMPDNFVPQAPRDCNNYSFQGQPWNCGLLDRCDPNADLLLRLACCDCDPEVYCVPDSSCEPPPDAPPPPEPPPPPPNEPPVESCMSCHNGARERNDYTGAGMSNPHPFPGAELIRCTQCHGGDAAGAGPLGSHVPPPPALRGDQLLIQDPNAWFNRLTLAGIDKLEPANYTAPETGERQWTNLDYIQFVNPGDLRVVSQGRGCGAEGCHFNQHAQWVPRAMLAGSIGIMSATRFTTGAENRIPEHRGRDKFGDSLADVAPRAIENPAYTEANRGVGEVGHLIEQREVADYNGQMRDNPVYDANTLANFLDNTDPSRPNRVRANSPLDELLDEQVSITCGDCHFYSAGANNRYGDFRSSGCTACHMQYSMDGRSRSTDRNVNKFEPANPDAIAAPERPHIEAHQIRNVAKLLPNGSFLRGISDNACVGCHQGSNRTVLQFWGIRLDQNQDLANATQYPANPDTFANTQNDERLYPTAVANNTFNGRNFNQYILEEDYDADGRDDTPPDLHYEAGMGCIDCHGSRDVHNGTADDPTSGKIQSRQDQATSIQCENCHGTDEAYAITEPCVTYQGQPAQRAVDERGNPLRNVTLDPGGNFWLISRVSTQRLYVPQTRDTIVNTNKTHPLEPTRFIYNPKASYAMGRADGNPQNGIGPVQANPANARVRNQVNFSHMDRMDCVSCHSTWNNNCIGCHLKNQYDVNPANFFASNITGKRILLFQANADFVYQNPIPMYLGVNSRGKVAQMSPAEKFFYRYQDLNGNESAVLTFSDRLGEGRNPVNGGRNAFPSLQMNQMMPHSLRARVTAQYEGPRYCVSCHLNQDQINNFGADYAAFIAAYQANDFANLDFNLLQTHIGLNPGNQLNSPFFVHMAAGRGTGLFLFDQNGCPVNPLDNNANRQNCGGNAPADIFDVNNVVYDLDRFVEFNGVNNAGSAHPMLDFANPRQVRRINGSNAEMAGPLPGDLIQMMSDPNTGVVLDSWIDADGNAQGDAANFIQ